LSNLSAVTVTRHDKTCWGGVKEDVKNIDLS